RLDAGIANSAEVACIFMDDSTPEFKGYSFGSIGAAIENNDVFVFHTGMSRRYCDRSDTPFDQLFFVVCRCDNAYMHRA
ncbi:MAG: hypothetical protein MI741_02400, partial [Rhodospirillales bacterium]|nr:hypothetical protein [Rhodospirillales bacterium]